MGSRPPPLPMTFPGHLLLRGLLLGMILAGSACTEPPRTVPLRRRTSDQLVLLLGTKFQGLTTPSTDTPDASCADICAILLERREVPFLLRTFQHAPGGPVRLALVSQVLYQIDDAAILHAFRERLSEAEDEESYYLANYVAKHGDVSALELLNRHFFRYPVSSLQWSYTVALFGQFRYQPAAPNLVASLDAASLNLAGEALEALLALYPDAPRRFDTRAAAREYFQSRVAAGSTPSL